MCQNLQDCASAFCRLTNDKTGNVKIINGIFLLRLSRQHFQKHCAFTYKQGDASSAIFDPIHLINIAPQFGSEESVESSSRRQRVSVSLSL